MLAPEAAFRVDGKVAVVTGASAGLGARMARALSAAGASVVVTARRLDRLEALAAELGDALPVACDLGNIDQMELPVRRAVEAFGKVDIVVNNAAMEATAPAEEESTDTFHQVLKVNLLAPFVLSRTAAQDILAREATGSIINISSILGLVGVGQIPQAAYTASKGGLINLTRELSAQWSRRGIRVNAIAPGFFRSEMTEQMLSHESGHKWVTRRTPMNRWGEPEELDGPLLFLASDASSYVTGATLSVDGGWVTV